MTVVQVIALVLVAGGATGVALTRDPLRQAIVVAFYGILLELLFYVLGAPDVALAEIAIGTVVVPLLILLALVRIRRDEQGSGEEADG